MRRKTYPLRTIAKAISWRTIATLTTTGLVYLFTGKPIMAVGVGLLELALKISFYYVHERVWERISWGRPRHPLEGLPVTRELAPEDMQEIRRRLEELGYL
ncbi:MAG TPA: DUF2061 domain-containing protein [Anaerolineales bacterium]|nr:DUF2061 domain-containing protein [Anaerolineales bacterium]